MVHYKLTYITYRGLAEMSRLLLHYADVPFEDSRLDMKGPEWLALKPSKIDLEFRSKINF